MLLFYLMYMYLNKMTSALQVILLCLMHACEVVNDSVP